MEAGLSSPEVRRHLQAEAQHHRRVLRECGVSAAARELLEEMRRHQEESCTQVRPPWGVRCTRTVRLIKKYCARRGDLL